MSKYMIEVNNPGKGYEVIELTAGSMAKALKKLRRAFGDGVTVLGMSRLDKNSQPVTPSNLSTRARVPASNIVPISKPKVVTKSKPVKPKYKYRVTEELLIQMGHPAPKEEK